MLLSENQIPLPPYRVIILFRRDLDAEIYYKSHDGGITKVDEEDDVYRIQNIAGLLPFGSYENRIGEEIEVIRNTPQEFFFKICDEKLIVVNRKSKNNGGGSGISGYSGYSGFSGYSGYSGFSGSGTSGFSGYSGYSGISGFSGYSGYSGISGFSGYSGYSGYSGFSGESGYSGFSGISGYSGYSGFSGISGFSGESGYSGYSGISGYSGYSGFSGISGFSGYSGYSGFSGFSGISGYSGYSGFSGYSGYSGFSGNTGQGGMFIHWNSGGNLANNNYQLYGQQDTTENHTQIVMTKASTVQNLFVRLTVAPGGVATRTFTIRLNGANTALTVTITGAATTGSNVVNTVGVVAFDLISLIQTQAGGPAGATGIASVQVI